MASKQQKKYQKKILSFLKRSHFQGKISEIKKELKITKKHTYQFDKTLDFLIQTGKIRDFPLVLFGSKYWRGLLDWLAGSVEAEGKISSQDLDLIIVATISPDSNFPSVACLVQKALHADDGLVSEETAGQFPETVLFRTIELRKDGCPGQCCFPQGQRYAVLAQKTLL